MRYIHEKAKGFKIEGVTDEMILKADSTIKNDLCRSLKIMDKLEHELEMVHITLIKYNMVVGEIICNGQLDTEELCLPTIMNSHIDPIIVELKSAWINPSQAFISSSLWTCECKSEYVRSKLNPICDKCGTTIWRSKDHLKPLTTLTSRIKSMEYDCDIVPKMRLN